MPAGMMNMPTLDEQAIKACGSEIDMALKKYNCALVFQEVRHNGNTTAAGFVVVKQGQNAPPGKLIQ